MSKMPVLCEQHRGSALWVDANISNGEYIFSMQELNLQHCCAKLPHTTTCCTKHVISTLYSIVYPHWVSQMLNPENLQFYKHCLYGSLWP